MHAVTGARIIDTLIVGPLMIVGSLMKAEEVSKPSKERNFLHVNIAFVFVCSRYDDDM